jgi:hypothetical protein
VGPKTDESLGDAPVEDRARAFEGHLAAGFQQIRQRPARAQQALSAVKGVDQPFVEQL